MVIVDRLRGFLDKLDRRLGPNAKYALGKRHKRNGRYAEAIAAFREAEIWLVEERGPDHPFVISAIVNQAACYGYLGNLPEACHNYERALAKLERRGDGDHAMARDIRQYLSVRCG